MTAIRRLAADAIDGIGVKTMPPGRRGLTDAEICELPAVIRVPDVAAIADTSTDTVYEMVKRGEIPALHLGRSLRFSKAAILNWIGGGA